MLPIVLIIVSAILLLSLVIGSGNAIVLAFLVLPIIVAAFTLRDYRFGVGVLVFLMPIASTKIMPHKIFGVTGFNPLNLAIAGTMFSLCLLLAFGRPRLPTFPWRYYGYFVAALVIAAVLGSKNVHLIPGYFYLTQESLYTTSMQYLRDEMVKPLLMLSAIWMLSIAVSHSKVPERWIRMVSASVVSLPALIFTVVLLSGYGLGDLASPSSRSFLSVTGLHANQLAVMLLPAFSAALFMLPAEKQPLARLLTLAVIGAVLLALLLTFSRAAFLGIVLVGCAFFFLRGKAAYIVAGLVVMLIVAAILPDAVVERATQGFGANSVGSKNDPLTAGRVGGIWIPLLPEIGKHLFLGNGINATMWSDPSRAAVFVEGHPHNAYLRLLMDHGIAGGLLVAAFLLHTWRLFRRLAKDETQPVLVRAYYQGISVSFVVFLIQCISGSTLLFNFLHIFYWFAIAIGLGLEEQKRQTARQSQPAKAAQRYRGVPLPANARST